MYNNTSLYLLENNSCENNKKIRKKRPVEI